MKAPGPVRSRVSKFLFPVNLVSMLLAMWSQMSRSAGCPGAAANIHWSTCTVGIEACLDRCNHSSCTAGWSQGPYGLWIGPVKTADTSHTERIDGRDMCRQLLWMLCRTTSSASSCSPWKLSHSLCRRPKGAGASTAQSIESWCAQVHQDLPTWRFLTYFLFLASSAAENSFSHPTMRVSRGMMRPLSGFRHSTSMSA